MYLLVTLNSQRYIPMSPLRMGRLLIFKKLEAPDQPMPCFTRFDDIVNESSFGGHKRIGVQLSVFLCFLSEHFIRISSFFNLVAMNDLSCAFGAKHSNFGCWPGKVYIATDVL